MLGIGLEFIGIYISPMVREVGNEGIELGEKIDEMESDNVLGIK